MSLPVAFSLEKEVGALDAKVAFILYLMPKCQVKIYIYLFIYFLNIHIFDCCNSVDMGIKP